MTVMVLRPRKSNLTRPAFSTRFMSHWVTVSLFLPLYSGTYSVMAVSETTTPAAWVEAWRASPSRRRETSMRRATRASEPMRTLSSGSRTRALSMVILSSSGMSLAMRSVSPKVMPRARPTSRTTALAFMVPNVVIWATASSPYRSVT